MENREKRRGKKGMEIIIIYPVRMLLGFVRRKNEERREWKKEAKTQ